MNRSISAKQYIKEFLIEGIGDIIKNHAYFGFPLICSGIEFLGICLDSASNWNDEKKSARHFKDAVDKLFPNVYAPIKNQLYKELRCGMIHAQLSGNFKLTEVKNDSTGTLTYQKHLVNDTSLLVLDYFYFDFVQACMQVISMNFPANDKMDTPIIYVGAI
jgi:hypothetical protein